MVEFAHASRRIALPPRLRGLRAVWLAGLAAALANCSSGDPGNEHDPANETQAGRQTETFPPGAAAALSIVGAMDMPDADPFSGAVNCAVAIQMTAKMVSGMAQVGEAERDALRQGELIYRERAAAAAPAVGIAAAEVPAAIEARTLYAQESPGPQAQLAMACLRELSG